MLNWNISIGSVPDSLVATSTVTLPPPAEKLLKRLGLCGMPINGEKREGEGRGRREGKEGGGREGREGEGKEGGGREGREGEGKEGGGGEGGREGGSELELQYNFMLNNVLTGAQPTLVT